MNKIRNELISGSPAAYPSTASTEIETRNIFQDLLNPIFIKGDIRTMDKYPNSDGILEITDNEQFPIGKIDIQLKTLSPKNYKSPRFQCKRNYFVYCQNCTIPAIIIVVDRKNKRAYWRHIDRTTLLEVSENIKGKSYSLSVPKENCIDGMREDYIISWTKITRDVSEKIWNYDFLEEEYRNLKLYVNHLEDKLKAPTHLHLSILEDIHSFLDRYNYILDLEFGAIKKVLYPKFWKIGIGILKYVFGQISFLLYPVEFNESQTLIKVVKRYDLDNLSREMSEGKILLFVNLIKVFKMRITPNAFAYNLLEDSIMRVAEKYNFPIPDEFLAHEYIISFISFNHGYLDMDKFASAYSLKELKFKLYSVLPMITATSKTFADWVVDFNDNIDSYSHWESSLHHKKTIEENIERVNQGFIPKVRVTMTSELYNIDLITYYINLLEKKGIYEAKRKYKIGQSVENINDEVFWKTWVKDILWSNVQLFLDNFHRLYELYLDEHFPRIKDALQIVPNSEITVVYVFMFDKTRQKRPFMEIYYLRRSLTGKGEILSFLEEDPQNPIDRMKVSLENKYDCVIKGIAYEILGMQAQELDFMFLISPTYALINKNLILKLKQFFSNKKRMLN